MDFGLSEDQKMLGDSVGRLLGDRVDIDRVRALRDAGVRNDRAIWDALAELGATGILVPQRVGGAGLSLLDAAVVSQALGSAAAPTAYLGAAVMAPVALSASNLDGADEELESIASGRRVFGVAATEAFSVREGAGIRRAGDTLSGKAMMALDCGCADRILLVVDASTLAVVDAAAAGLQINALSTVDATRCTSELLFDGVRPRAVAEDAGEAVARMLDAGRVALCADVLGACGTMIERAVAYAAERKQFDRVIGSFQAVKHMCAEMVAELEPTRSLMWYAAHAFDASPDEAPLMACHALAHASEIGHDIASVATQVHGGIGWTDEQNLHFWFKRIATARHLLGGPQLLRERAAQMQGLSGS